MPSYFFDSSAIVKRYTKETGTAWVSGITDPMAGNDIYLAQITAVEVVSAFARQVRAGRATALAANAAAVQFQYDLLNQYEVAKITDALITRAMALAQSHALRGYDAVQLAAALIVNDQNLAFGLPALTLISSDAALNPAAAAEGLAADDPINHP